VSLRWVLRGENRTSGGFSAYSALMDVQVRNRSRTPRAALTSRLSADGRRGTGGGIYSPVFMVTCADIPPSIEIICPVM
jgi:hypothetical protein